MQALEQRIADAEAHGDPGVSISFDLAKQIIATLRQVDDLYSHAWDRADGGLSMFGSSVPKFEAAHTAVREALGIKLLAADKE